VIVGPTAVGKSAVGLEIAERLNGEIVSADSMQVYRGMDIGTAKATEDERARVRHHLLDVADPGEIFSVARYQELAQAAIEGITARGALAVMVGGTGLYVDAVVRGFLFPFEGRNDDIRQRLEQEANVVGSCTLHGRLREVDPRAAERIHPNDRRRIIRALEVHEVTGVPITELQRRHKGQSRYDTRQFGLTLPRDVLRERIDRRVDEMMSAGLLEEVRELVGGGYAPCFTAMQAIGYKELAAYLEGRTSLEEAVHTIKNETRKYAKRQMTWFRKNRDIEWVDISEYDEPEQVADEIITRLGEWPRGVDTGGDPA
jgi:tRNA dimethylallyltransferase